MKTNTDNTILFLPILAVMVGFVAYCFFNGGKIDGVKDYDDDFSYDDVLVLDKEVVKKDGKRPVFVVDYNNVISLIMDLEGWSDTSYLCPKKVLTIGYGRTNMGTKEINRVLKTSYPEISEGDKSDIAVEKKFIHDYAKCVDLYMRKNYRGWKHVLPYVKTTVISYCYQKGWYDYPGKVCGSDRELMVNALNDGDNDTIIELIESYANCDGYVNRRNKELKNAKLAKSGYYYNLVKTR